MKYNLTHVGSEWISAVVLNLLRLQCTIYIYLTWNIALDVSRCVANIRNTSWLRTTPFDLLVILWLRYLGWVCCSWIRMGSLLKLCTDLRWDRSCWAGQKTCLGFSIPSYGKTQVNFLANPVHRVDFPGDPVVKNLPANTRGLGLIPGSGRPMGERKSNSFPYS